MLGADEKRYGFVRARRVVDLGHQLDGRARVGDADRRLVAPRQCAVEGGELARVQQAAQALDAAARAAPPAARSAAGEPLGSTMDPHLASRRRLTFR